MIELGAHADFIIWAYAGVTLAVVALIAWVVTDARRIERRVAALEAQSGRRRSGTTA